MVLWLLALHHGLYLEAKSCGIHVFLLLFYALQQQVFGPTVIFRPLRMTVASLRERGRVAGVTTGDGFGGSKVVSSGWWKWETYSVGGTRVEHRGNELLSRLEPNAHYNSGSGNPKNPGRRVQTIFVKFKDGVPIDEAIKMYNGVWCLNKILVLKNVWKNATTTRSVINSPNVRHDPDGGFPMQFAPYKQMEDHPIEVEKVKHVVEAKEVDESWLKLFALE
ncbi:hypothetical protein U1Q18_028369 [Sarracenia purpurea var. burkii]